MDGNYFKICAERRFEEADHILYLDFPRRICLPRVLKRWITYRGKTRPDMGPGCKEKVDWPFLKWVVWDGRSPKKQAEFEAVAKQYPHKFHRYKSPRQLEKELFL